MKNILFIVNNGKISPNENGGASVYYSHLELLYSIGYTIDILATQWGENDTFNKSDFSEVAHMVRSIVPYKVISIKPKKNLKRIYNAFIRPQYFEYYFINQANNRFLKEICENQQIDLIWAEWRWAGIWTRHAEIEKPIIYAHHDWEYKLAKLRKKSGALSEFHRFQKKRVDFDLVSGVSGVISGSATEAEEVSFISKKEALYLPTTYAPIKQSLLANLEPNIIHLGGMGTTANRLGLERFLDVSWNEIKENNSSIKLIVIGSLKVASSQLRRKLEDPRIECLGFVKDLSKVLKPKDIHIIPWEYNTGTRTRLPLVLNYEQALVATRKSVIAFPELINGENAILCDSLEVMAKEICILAKDKKRLSLLSKNGKNTFEKNYTCKSNVERLENYVNQIFN